MQGPVQKSQVWPSARRNQRAQNLRLQAAFILVGCSPCPFQAVAPTWLKDWGPVGKETAKFCSRKRSLRRQRTGNSQFATKVLQQRLHMPIWIVHPIWDEQSRLCCWSRSNRVSSSGNPESRGRALTALHAPALDSAPSASLTPLVREAQPSLLPVGTCHKQMISPRSVAQRLASMASCRGMGREISNLMRLALGLGQAATRCPAAGCPAMDK
jgi:hypothetical protein